MSKKTQKRENAVISLSDRNAEQIKEIEAKTEEMVANYEKKKEGGYDIMYFMEYGKDTQNVFKSLISIKFAWILSSLLKKAALLLCTWFKNSNFPDVDVFSGQR